MAVPPERSRALHNFTLPDLRWGHQRTLRCMKTAANHAGEALGARQRSEGITHRAGTETIGQGSSIAKSPGRNLVAEVTTSGKSPGKNVVPDATDDDDGIEAVRERLMLDLRLAADRMKVSMLGERDREKEKETEPCNLRSRRERNHARLRGLATAATEVPDSGEERRERPKFSIQLSLEEIEADFITMTGKKPPRRPKKRPKGVQKQLDALFPATWLTEVTPEKYKVPDSAESGKDKR